LGYYRLKFTVLIFLSGDFSFFSHCLGLSSNFANENEIHTYFLDSILTMMMLHDSFILKMEFHWMKLSVARASVLGCKGEKCLQLEAKNHWDWDFGEKAWRNPQR